MKYLGINLDAKLNFLSHITSTEQKVSQAIEIISKIGLYIPQTALIKKYYSHIPSHLIFGLPAWGSTYPTYLDKLSAL